MVYVVPLPILLVHTPDAFCLATCSGTSLTASISKNFSCFSFQGGIFGFDIAVIAKILLNQPSRVYRSAHQVANNGR